MLGTLDYMPAEFGDPSYLGLVTVGVQYIVRFPVNMQISSTVAEKELAIRVSSDVLCLMNQVKVQRTPENNRISICL